MDGIDAAKIIHEANPDIKILMLSMHENPKYIHAATQNGINGYPKRVKQAMKYNGYLQNPRVGVNLWRISY